MFNIQPLNETYRSWAHDLIDREWGPPGIVTRGKLHDTTKLDGFIATENGERLGLITYEFNADACEIVSLNSLKEKKGVGSALVNAVIQTASAKRLRRVWTITINDNVSALRFYQKRGFHISAVYPNALEISRKLKPTIPLIGIDGIPLRDEIELEMLL